MAKTRKTSVSKSKTAGRGKIASLASSMTKTAVSKTKKTFNRDKMASSNLSEVEANGDDGIGKIRCKSLVIDGTKYRTQLNKKFENRKQWEYPDTRKLTSSIPGTILKINCKEGQAVKKGDQMLILEAMKMKNNILFNIDGTVKSILVKEGERVPKDFLMVVMD